MAAYPHHESLPPTDSISVVYSENDEEEIDQLASDFDDEEIPVGGCSSSKGKRSRRRSGERFPGQTLIPSSKLESILHSDAAPTPATNHLSKEALFMLSVATEEFIKKLAQAGHRECELEQRTEVTYNDLAAATQQYQEFMFLQDTIPQPLTVAEAFERRTAKEKALLTDDPAISSSSTYVPSFVTPSGLALTNAQKGKGKGKTATNGKTKPNGAAAGTSASAARRQRDRSGRYSNGDDEDMDFVGDEVDALPTLSRRNSRTSAVHGQEMDLNLHANGFQQGQWPASQHPPSEGDPAVDGQWAPQQYLGPASGFIQDRRLPFGNENPGRTIYSQR